jgi:hypothetical protein
MASAPSQRSDRTAEKCNEVDEVVSDHAVNASETRNNFRAMFDECLHGGDVLDDDGDIKQEDYECCENCGNKPCDWAELGPSIEANINNEHVGCSNKQLRFLAYSAYTSAKHGYLGKHKRVWIPHCMECGIRCNYPDENNNYVGFRATDD